MPRGRDRGESLPRPLPQSENVASARLRNKNLSGKDKEETVGYLSSSDKDEQNFREKRIPLTRGTGSTNSGHHKKPDDKSSTSSKKVSKDDSSRGKGLPQTALSGRHRPPLWRRFASRKQAPMRKKDPSSSSDERSLSDQKSSSRKKTTSVRDMAFSERDSIDLSFSREQESSTSSKIFSGKGVDGRETLDPRAATGAPQDDGTSENGIPPLPAPTNQMSAATPAQTGSSSQLGSRSPSVRKENDEIRKTRKVTKMKYKGKDLETSSTFTTDAAENNALVSRNYKSLISTSRAPQQHQIMATPKHDDCEAGLLQRILHALSGPAPILSSPFPRSISQALSPRPLPELLYRRHETVEDDNARQPGSSFLGARKILRKSCRYKRTSRPVSRDKSKRIRFRTKADLVRVISRSPSPKAQSEPPRENRRKLLRMMRESQAVYEASQSASTEERRKEVQRKANEYTKHRVASPLLDRADETVDLHRPDSGALQMVKEKKKHTHAPRKHD
ncbi:uncharacterized protein LOC111249960 isoform X2 [Varroa destructor]|uniref:Uncharacterized protein n=1 Tax=Varroa destructor TaxID=109461 RepID=A0A7M7MGH9_VARDE|nr:uncharacterized protein LOC111249960 isoform X2 [Varroa destructor]